MCLKCCDLREKKTVLIKKIIKNLFLVDVNYRDFEPKMMKIQVLKIMLHVEISTHFFGKMLFFFIKSCFQMSIKCWENVSKIEDFHQNPNIEIPPKYREYA